MSYDGPNPLPVIAGGTGDDSFTVYAPVCGGTTTAGNLQSADTGIATSGFVLTSTGNASLPTFQTVSASGAITTIDGDTGSATPTAGILTFNANSNSGSTVNFTASGSTVDLIVSSALSNTIIGALSGNGTISGSENTGLGVSIFEALTSGTGNTAIGFTALNSVTSNGGNVAIGTSSLVLATGANNTAVGYNSLDSLVGGSTNIALGFGAGSGYTGSESSNIVIGNGGTAAESNVIRLGVQGSGGGQQNKFFAAGIAGVTGTSSAVVVGFDTSTDQLLQTTITAGTGISVTPAGGTITIASTGSEMSWTDEAVSFNAAAGNGYFITAGSVVATLPGAPAQGNTISFAVDTSSSFEILANTGQIIRIGAAVSASAGNAVSNAQGDSVTLVYRSSDTAWIATSVIGTWVVT